MGSSGVGSMPNKPHGRDCPDRCSQCLGAVARRVSIDATMIDGQPGGRSLDPLENRASYYARRGGIMKGRRTHQ